MDTNYVSDERLEELKKELGHLKTKRRIEVAEHLKRAKEYGDLSENSEYAEAKEEQRQVETRIFELEELVKKAVVIQKTGSGDCAQIGSKVTVRRGADELAYSIVGSNEARPEEGKLSNESPIGRALIGKKVGENFTVRTPGGEVSFEVVKIE